MGKSTDKVATNARSIRVGIARGLVYPRWALVLALFGPAIILTCMRVFGAIPLSVGSISRPSFLLAIPDLGDTTIRTSTPAGKRHIATQ